MNWFFYEMYEVIIYGEIKHCQKWIHNSRSSYVSHNYFEGIFGAINKTCLSSKFPLELFVRRSIS